MAKNSVDDESKLDARVLKSRQIVLKITWELLSETGLAGVSIDEVARRSGVAKTTIYRHWNSRWDLLIDACSQISATQAVPDKGTLAKDLLALTLELADMLANARWASVLPSVMDEAERNVEIAKMHSRLQREHASPYRQVILRGVKRGELSARTDVNVLTAQIIGPLFYRRWFSREPLDRKFVNALVASVLAR